MLTATGLQKINIKMEMGLNGDLPRQPFEDIKEPGKMANPVHTGPGFTESVMHTLLERLVIKKVVRPSEAVVGDDINSKTGIGAAHKHRLSRVLMSLKSVREFIDGLDNQWFQSPH